MEERDDLEKKSAGAAACVDDDDDGGDVMAPDFSAPEDAGGGEEAPDSGSDDVSVYGGSDMIDDYREERGGYGDGTDFAFDDDDGGGKDSVPQGDGGIVSCTETDSELLELAYIRLVDEASKPDYQFAAFADEWGYRGSSRYNSLELSFISQVRRLARSCGVKYSAGSFYIYNNGIYCRLKDNVLETAYFMLIEHLRIAPMLSNKVFCRKFFLDTIRFYCSIRMELDVVGFKNGILDLSCMSKENGYVPGFYTEGSPRFHITRRNDFPFVRTAKCPLWQSFLHEVLPDKTSRKILQMFMGLGLTRRDRVKSARVELCLLLLGSGANGKSVIFDTMTGIFGKEKFSHVDYDELVAGGDEGMRARRLLRGALFNWSSDSDYKTFGRKRTGVFKRIVSGEPVTDRKLGSDVEENDEIPYLIFNLNQLPFFDDRSLGFMRRIQIVPFNVTIPRERQNPSLARDLRSEYPGIFNWVLRGAKELRRRHYSFPSSVQSEKRMMLALVKKSPVEAWFSAYGMRPDMYSEDDPYDWIGIDDMLASLNQFCLDNDAEQVSRQMLGQRLSRAGTHGFFKRRAQGGFLYKVYGCTRDELMIPHVISEDEHENPFEEDPKSYLKPED